MSLNENARFHARGFDTEPDSCVACLKIISSVNAEYVE